MFYITNPESELIENFSFKEIHYFSWPHYLREEYTWLVWTEGQTEVINVYFDMDDMPHKVIIEKEHVKGMIELQAHGNELWIKFIEVSPNFRNQGLSKIMILELIEAIKLHQNKRIVISSFSNDGISYLEENLRRALSPFNIMMSQ